MSSRIWRRGAWLFACLLCTAVRAQAPDQQASNTFGERVEVELVNLRVWVEDAKGEPALGLGREDFALEVDGRPVQITHFAEVRAARTEAGPEPFEASTPTPSESGDSTPTLDEEAWLVLYLDELHVGFGGRKRLLSDLRRLLESEDVDPARVLLLRQTSELSAEVSFGSDLQRLLTALDRLEEPAENDTAPAEKHLVVQLLWQEWERARQLDPTGDPCRIFVRQALFEIGNYARRARMRSEITARHLREATSLLAGLSGVKTLLYVGDQLEIRPGEDLLSIVHGLCPQVADNFPSTINSQEVSELFETLTRAANTSRVTLYSLQPRGLEAGLSGPEQQTTNGRVQSRFQRLARQAERTGLRELSARTGGKTFTGRNRFGKQLRGMARDLGTYYSLGFPPPGDAQNGQYRISVRVEGQGLQTRYRRDLRRKDERERLEDQVVTTIHLGHTPNPLGVRLASGAIDSKGSGTLMVPLHVRIPVDRITYLPGDRGEQASLEVLVLARGPQLDESPRWVRIFRFQRPEEASGLVDLVIELELPPGLHTLGVGVKDEATGEASFVSTTVELWGGRPRSE